MGSRGLAVSPLTLHFPPSALVWIAGRPLLEGRVRANARNGHHKSLNELRIYIRIVPDVSSTSTSFYDLEQRIY